MKNVAEREGFEPSVGLPPQRFSRPSRSAAPASLRKNGAYNARFYGILTGLTGAFEFK